VVVCDENLPPIASSATATAIVATGVSGRAIGLYKMLFYF